MLTSLTYFQVCFHKLTLNQVMNPSLSTKMNHMSWFVMLPMSKSKDVSLQTHPENHFNCGLELRKYSDRVYLSWILFDFFQYLYNNQFESYSFHVFVVMKAEESHRKEMEHLLAL